MLMFEFIKQEFDKISRELGWNILLKFDMPSGYETAFGTFDVVKNTLFINKSINDNERLIYTFYHELRHAQQYLFLDKFSKDIQESINYVVLYDGSAFKLENGKWLGCKLKGDTKYFTEAYKSLPYEIDANNYAYEMVSRVSGLNLNRIDEIYKTSKAVKLVPMKELKKLFKCIEKEKE